MRILKVEKKSPDAVHQGFFITSIILRNAEIDEY